MSSQQFVDRIAAPFVMMLAFVSVLALGLWYGARAFGLI